MKVGKSLGKGPAGAAERQLRKDTRNRKDDPAGETRRVSCSGGTRKGRVGERFPPEEGYCPIGGAGRPVTNGGESHRDGGPGGTDEVLRRLGGRSALVTGKRK